MRPPNATPDAKEDHLKKTVMVLVMVATVLAAAVWAQPKVAVLGEGSALAVSGDALPQKTASAPASDLRPKKTWPLWLNLAPGFGVGSFVQGDTAGGVVGLIGCIAGDVLFYAGYMPYYLSIIDDPYGDASIDSDSLSLMVAGEAILIGTSIYGIFRPISYARRWNREHGFASIDVAPTLSMTSSSGGAAMAPGAVIRLSY